MAVEASLAFPRLSCYDNSKHRGMGVASRTSREAIEAFMQPLQRSLSCITDAVLNYRSYSNKGYPSQEPLPLTINNGYPVPLLIDDDLFLSFSMSYHVAPDSKGRGPWEVAIVGYSYSLDDRDHKEILAYHWHPDTRNSVDFPHMHLGAGTGMTRQELFRAHLPTGHIALVDMIRLTITEFGTQALRGDWREVLAAHSDLLGV